MVLPREAVAMSPFRLAIASIESGSAVVATGAEEQSPRTMPKMATPVKV